MQTIDIRHQLNLYGRKIGITLFLFFLLGISAMAQDDYKPLNKSGQDNQFISYGFFLAGHNSSLRLKYSDAYMDPNADYSNIQSIMPIFSPGFSLGFLITTRLHDQFNFLITPKVGFYEFQTDINYLKDDDFEETGVGVNTETIVTEMTMVELPLIFKYKSHRFNNTRMFFTGGVNPQFRTKSQEEADADDLVLTGSDIALELGMGFDFYFKFFKFSPEIRFSHGMKNLYKEETSNPEFSGAISEIRRKSITLYLNFQ
ncbi:outer membrane beta-barrel protein [Echinicola jeungdonensis]|uniref:Outer membrane beta-barrel protein n=1 Tax=Echinicola jeungdonensis TaxID=709343 RepID=A0ABV5J4B6_9BACT|nr:outer membrane beta-barrel protein [Echinicola jeungdonensis]MDN3669600.1 outer membrane beta-barrel protein [Echinicola jeungdonensis]